MVSQDVWIKRQQIANGFRSRLDERFPSHGLVVEVFSGGLCVVTCIGHWRASGEAERFMQAIDQSADLPSFVDRLRELAMMQESNGESAAIDV